MKLKTIKSKGVIHYGYVIVFCCCLIMGVNVGLVMSCAGIFYQPVSAELGVSVGKLGVYMSLNYLFSSLALSVAGRMMEKYSARLLLSVSSSVMGACLVSMSFFNSVWQFYVAGSVLGVTLAFLLYLSFPILINRWFKSRVGFFIGICSAASGIGGVLFNPLGAYLITEYGWRMTYSIFGAIILLIISPVIGLLLRDYPKDKNVQPYGETVIKENIKPSEGVGYAQALRMPEFYSLLLFAFLMISVSTLNLFIPDYVTGLSFSLEEAAFVASAVMIGATVGKIALGAVNDYSNRLGVLMTAVLGIAGLILLLARHFAGLWLILTGGFFFGWAYAGVTVQTLMLVRTVFGSRNYAQIYSNISIAFACGGALTAGGWGLLADHIGYSVILCLGIVFLALSACIGFYALRKRLY